MAAFSTHDHPRYHPVPAQSLGSICRAEHGGAVFLILNEMVPSGSFEKCAPDISMTRMDRANPDDLSGFFISSSNLDAGEYLTRESL